MMNLWFAFTCGCSFIRCISVQTSNEKSLHRSFVNRKQVYYWLILAVLIMKSVMYPWRKHNSFYEPELKTPCSYLDCSFTLSWSVKVHLASLETEISTAYESCSKCEKLFIVEPSRVYFALYIMNLGVLIPICHNSCRHWV